MSSANADTRLGAALEHGDSKAEIRIEREGRLRTYRLTSNVPLRDNRPADKRVVFSEQKNHPTVRTGNLMFDGLYAMAVHESIENSVPEIKDYAYNHGNGIRLAAFETGEKWHYVWTRDLAYSVHLGLAGFDPQRAQSSLMFKASSLKPSVSGDCPNQIIQDTGSGGSWPVSTDRVVWALGAWETLKYLEGRERDTFLKQIYPILRDTIEHDRIMVYDPTDGLYRGEQSFLDWREQTYPGWTKEDVLPIAMSKALSVNALNCFMLETASKCAAKVGAKEEAARYARWAADLKVAINQHFYDSDAGLYSTYLLSDGLCAARVKRYDLLGTSLAILFDVADSGQAKRIIENYPVGKHGPPVVWPQERTVPIYHNQGIWPFVTAYWVKAARQAGNAEVVDLGAGTMQRLAALNLSNMENFDFVSGLAEVSGQSLNGPVINSRRQLWSVAGYLSMVQDIVFGAETSWDGIRFRPFLTAHMRNDTFSESEFIELRGFSYLGTRNDIQIYLPPAAAQPEGAYAIKRLTLNGIEVGGEFVPSSKLKQSNQWKIHLKAEHSGASSINLVDVEDKRVLYAPLQPEWVGEGIAVEGGKLELSFSHPSQDVTFNIYRDGELVAERIGESRWVDEASSDHASKSHCYSVVAVDPETGNESHPAPFLRHTNKEHEFTILAKAMENRGGRLADDHHFMDWGRPDDELDVRSFSVKQDGRYMVRANYAGGMPINTGVTCGIKAFEVLEGKAVSGSGYFIMPHTVSWDRWKLSSPVCVELEAGKEYRLHIFEDGYAHNMSHMGKNKPYTALPGGGDEGFNIVDIAALQIELLTAAER